MAVSAQSDPLEGDRKRYRAAWALLRQDWWIVAMCAIVGALAGLGLSLAQTPTYASTATLYVTAGSEGTAQSAYQGSLASELRVASYSKLVKSDAVVRQALSTAGLGMTVSQAKEALSASAAPDTVLLTISAQSVDQGVATRLADGVARAMSDYVTQLEMPTASAQPLAKLTVVTPATPEGAVSPRTYRNTGGGLIVGLLIGLVALYVRHRLDARVHDEAALTEVVGSPVLSSIPKSAELGDPQAVNFGAGAGVTAEAYRRLRTNLSFVSVDHPVKTVLVTSATQDEGKTTTAVNLAAALAEAGNRVVLVDADLRRPSVSKLPGINPAVGLTSFLRGDASVESVVQQSGVIGLDVLAAGALPPNPSELLASARTGAAFSSLAKAYDYVIIDSAPILPVTDSVEAARWVEGTILVARADTTTRPHLASAVAQLRMAEVNIVGVVLNDVSRRSAGYYGYGYTSELAESPGDDVGVASR
ncbi:polysaccharide biosynthesis tyrosine autokinase [Gordonia alkanivorans]|uniref:polysaccharide biosynthesis tyrosine autokinase n=1 Tax=Gordonia alkanivorans TaxID=84096 RepID=UPI002448F63F|nr:polysaccharide biosynthesis tyrosine autokinase [Gordonia alkanivorans]MDH3022464.1 polysaccharide biosynthesis tyrosine autokinase [Gordonia alkanivorans]